MPLDTGCFDSEAGSQHKMLDLDWPRPRFHVRKFQLAVAEGAVDGICCEMTTMEMDDC